jgi:hypothetical protein
MAFKFRATSYHARLKPGLYEGKLTAIEERSSDNGPYLRWTFAIDHHGDEVEVSALSSTKFSPTAKARKYAEALLGRTIKEGEELTPTELYGCTCQLVVAIDTLSDGGSINRVEQVLPVKPGQDGEDDVPF